VQLTKWWNDTLPNEAKPNRCQIDVFNRRQFLIVAAALGSVGVLGTVAGANLPEAG
jgi:hypothetical protein